MTDSYTLPVRQLPAMDLSVGFAVELPSGKIRQYIVRPQAVFNELDVDSDRSYLGYSGHARKIFVAYLEAHPIKLDKPYSLAFEGSFTVRPLTTLPIPPNDLLNDTTVKALEQARFDTMFVGSTLPTFGQKVWFYVAHRLNKAIFWANEVLADLARMWYKIPNYVSIFEDDRIWNAMVIPYLPYPPRKPEGRVINLAIQCREEDVLKAATALAHDLNALADCDLILGHLALPQMMELANTVGNNKKVLALFAMPMVEANRKVPFLQTACMEGALTSVDRNPIPYVELIESQEYIGETYIDEHKAVQEDWKNENE